MSKKMILGRDHRRCVSYIKQELEERRTMKPIAFKRKDDGEVFTLHKNGLYQNDKFREEFPDSLFNEWSVEWFLNDSFTPITKKEK